MYYEFEANVLFPFSFFSKWDFKKLVLFLFCHCVLSILMIEIPSLSHVSLSHERLMQDFSEWCDHQPQFLGLELDVVTTWGVPLCPIGWVHLHRCGRFWKYMYEKTNVWIWVANEVDCWEHLIVTYSALSSLFIFPNTLQIFIWGTTPPPLCYSYTEWSGLILDNSDISTSPWHSDWIR